MQINNLNINILYLLCHPDHPADHREGLRYEEVMSAFSDLPHDDVRAVIHSMAEEALIRTDPPHTRITITEIGIHRLQSSLACKIHGFGSCQCDR